MKNPDTSLGGADARFPITTLDIVECLKSPSPRPGIEHLARRYWKPVYHFLRADRPRSNEEAKDLTQAFFLWLIEGNPLERFRPEKGSLRAFLKALLRNFAAHQDEARNRLKRGGHLRFLNLDEQVAPPDLKLKTPEEALDRAWVGELIRRAVARVRERMASDGHSLQFRAFELYDMTGVEDEATYGRVAAQLGVRESDVRNHLYFVREEVRAELRREIEETLDDPEDIDEEWRDLFGV